MHGLTWQILSAIQCMRSQKLSLHPNIEFESLVGSRLQHLSFAQSLGALGFHSLTQTQQ